MPTYAYVCDTCSARKDVQHGMADQPSVRCMAGHAMRKDVAAAFPHVSLQWHKDQGIGDRLVIQSARRRERHGHPAVAGRARP
jgi:putative FmdB family regulatory protein